MADSAQNLDFVTARDLPEEQAAFFSLGPSKLVAEGVAFLPALGNVTAFDCGDGVAMVDTAQQMATPRILQGLRDSYTQAPIHSVVYTHGHVDHATGGAAILEHSSARGDPRPRFIAHKALPVRFDRYKLLAEQNDNINRIQFNLPPTARPFSNASFTYPDTVHDDGTTIKVGDTVFELHHARGETDDETWVWCPSRRVLCTGDTFVWCSPNAGNPYKVQRYAKDWADALEIMAGLKPLHLLPGHGPSMEGEGGIEEALLSTAHLLRSIHDQVVAGMNQGKWLEDIIRGMDWPATDKPWLQPIYDHPEFIARNIWRLYGGWYDGDPANMLPAHSHEVAAELLAAAGSSPILDRARSLRERGELQMACHLVDFVRKGEPDNKEAWELWRDLFKGRAEAERSLMARGAFYSAVREAEANLQRLEAVGMDDLERLLIERACARLVTEYCHFVDHGEAAKIADQFTEDGVWTSPENTMTGRDAIRRGSQIRQDNVERMSRHVCNNLLIDVIDENNAKGVVYLTLYRHDGKPERLVSPSDVPAIVGEYRDTFVRTPAGWRFKRREASVSFIKMGERGVDATTVRK